MLVEVGKPNHPIGADHELGDRPPRVIHKWPALLATTVLKVRPEIVRMCRQLGQLPFLSGVVGGHEVRCLASLRQPEPSDSVGPVVQPSSRSASASAVNEAIVVADEPLMCVR